MLNRKSYVFLLLVFLAAGCVENPGRSKIYWEETVVAGGPDRFMEVRRVVVKGSNYEIGRKIAEIAKRNNIRLQPSGNPSRNADQRGYIKEYYPEHCERMRGFADGYGLAIDDDAYDFSVMEQFPGIIECSAVFYPAGFTQSGHDLLSRNFDFTTGDINGKRVGTGQPPVMSRPYIFEVYPDEGYASLYITAFDLLGGALDGINSEGLTVSVFGEVESMSADKPAPGVGVHEIQCLRYLLDNCADVQQAKRAMLGLKHYYTVVPCHYIIADSSGKSFIFEFSLERDKAVVVDGDGLQCITNHLVSKYQTADQLPKDNDDIEDSFERLEKLRTACKKGGRFSLGQIKEINAKVAISAYIPEDDAYAPARTLWHSVYDLDERKLSVKFYLGEGPVSNEGENAALHYSDYLDFYLDCN